MKAIITKIVLLLCLMAISPISLSQEETEVISKTPNTLKSPEEVLQYYSIQLENLNNEIALGEAEYASAPTPVNLAILLSRKAKREIFAIYLSKVLKRMSNLNLNNFLAFAGIKSDILDKQRQLESNYDIIINYKIDPTSDRVVDGLGFKLLKMIAKDEVSPINRTVDVNVKAYKDANGAINLDYTTLFSSLLQTELSGQPPLEIKSYPILGGTAPSNSNLLTKQYEEALESYVVILINKKCHYALTPSGMMFDECYNDNNQKVNGVTYLIQQGNYCVTSIEYNNQRYNWNASELKFTSTTSTESIHVAQVTKEQNNKVNVFRITAPGCNYQSTSINWLPIDAAQQDIQATISGKLNNSTDWKNNLFSDVKKGTCGTVAGATELMTCPNFPNNMQNLTVQYLVDNFFAYSPTSCLSGVPFTQRMSLLRSLLSNWVVTECLQNINPNIPKIGNCYEPLVYKLILSTPPNNAKQMFDSLNGQNLLIPLLNKTQFDTFDEVVKKIASWQLIYYPLSGQDAITGKLNNTTKGIDFVENLVTGGIETTGINLIREGHGHCKECVPVTELNITVPATSYVVVNFLDGFENFSAGSKAKMPALFALYIFNKDRRDFIKAASKIAFDVVLLAIGVGEVKAAIEAYRLGKTAYQAYIGLKALGDLGMSLGDMFVNNVMADSWKNTPQGRARLERWNTISMYWAIGSISTSVLESALKKYCKNNPSTRVLDNENDFDNLANELEAAAGTSSTARKLSVLDKLANFPAARNFVNSLDEVTEVALLNRLDNLNSNQLQKLNDFYTNLDHPAGFAGQFSYSATKNIDGQNISITYNKGLPDFSDYSPSFNFQNGSRKYKFQANDLNGESIDFSRANTALANDLGIQKVVGQWQKNIDGFVEQGNYRWKPGMQQFELRNPSGTWESYTWHHFEDGTTLIPVKSSVHSKNIGGFPHSGGKTIINSNLQGLFEFNAF